MSVKNTAEQFRTDENPEVPLSKNKGGETVSTDRFIREKECGQITGLSRTSRYRLEKNGEFPSRRKLGGRCVGWVLSEVMEWKNSREAPANQNDST